MNYIISKKIGQDIYELPSISKGIYYYSDNQCENDNIKYTIRAENAAGSSDESDEKIFYPGLKPGKVLNLKTTIVQKNRIVIQFNEPENNYY